MLADQADLGRAMNLPTKAEKGRYVYEALSNKSQATQGPVLKWLRERGIEHRSFYIVNALLVKGGREIAEALASRQDVVRIGKAIRAFAICCLTLLRLLTTRGERSLIQTPAEHHLHARAGCLGAGVQRSRNYDWRRGYWPALDTQCIEASLPRVESSRGRSQLQLA